MLDWIWSFHPLWTLALFSLLSLLANLVWTVRLRSRERHLPGTTDKGRRFLSLLDHFEPVILWEADLERLAVTFVSSNCAQTLGFTPDDIRTLGPTAAPRLLSEFDFRRVRELAQTISSGGASRALELEHRVRHKDGRWLWFHTYISIQPQHQTTALGLSLDVTDFKRIQNQHDRTREWFQGILDHAPAAIYLKDRDGRHMISNRELERLTGLPGDRIRGRTDADIFGVDRARHFASHDEVVWSTGQPREFEELLDLKGEMKSYLSIKFPIFVSGDPRPWAIGGISSDITRRRSTETLSRGQTEILQLLAEGHSLMAVLDHLSGLLDSLFPGGRSHILFIDPSQGATRFAGGARLPLEFRQIFEGESPDQLTGTCGRSFREGRFEVGLDLETAPHSAKLRPWLKLLKIGVSWSQPVIDPKGRSLGVITLYLPMHRGPRSEDMDILALSAHIMTVAVKNHRALEELRQAKTRAELAAQAKTFFLANLSHEVRTPLGLIQNFAEFLSDSGRLNLEERGWLTEIKTQTQNLTRLMAALLDATKLEAEPIDIHPSTFSLAEFLNEIRAGLEAAAQKKGLRFSFSEGSPLPARVRTDRERLRQTLYHITGNAFKFTRQGQVRVEVRAVTSPQQGSLLKWTITDTGIGLHPDHIQKLFHPFSQADPSISRRFGGAGIGLYIAKKFAQALGGDLVYVKRGAEIGAQFELTMAVELDSVSQTPPLPRSAND